MKTYIIHQIETDGDIVIREINSSKKVVEEYLKEHGLTEGDYAIIYGDLIKDFDAPANYMGIL